MVTVLTITMTKEKSNSISMRIDKRIQTEEKAIGPFKVSEKETVEVVPFKPKPNSPFGTSGGFINPGGNKPEEEDKRFVSNAMPLEEQYDFYYQQLSPIYKMDYLKSLSLGELDGLLQERIKGFDDGGLVSIYKKNLRKP